MYDKWVDIISSHIIFNLEKNECINETILIFLFFFAISWGCADEWNFIFIFFNVVWMDPWPHFFTKRQCVMHMEKWD